MASSSSLPVLPTSSPSSPLNYLFDIHLMKSIIRTIHSTDLIHRQPTEPLRSSATSMVSLLENRITKMEELLKKRKCVSKRLQRFLTRKDRDYDAFIELKGELNRFYEELVDGATPTPPAQDTTPGSSRGISESRSSSDKGLWMKGHRNKHKDAEEEKSIDEQVEESVLKITLTAPTPGSLKVSTEPETGSSETIWASGVNPPKRQKQKRKAEKMVNEQIDAPSNAKAKKDEGEPTSTLKAKAPKESTKSDSSSDEVLWVKGSNRTKSEKVKKAPDEKMI